ncbi:MAG: hypothetical protein GY711_16310 [bacterium]|nr:hypothetical protein [bacterium]
MILGIVLAAFAQQPGPRPLGEALVSDHGCVACHAAAPEVARRLGSKSAPRLEGVAGRVSPSWLRDYLLDPRAQQPGSTMPALLDALPAERASEVADDLLHFLMTLGEPLGPEPQHVSPHAFERGRLVFHEVGCIACHAPQESMWALDSSYIDAIEAGEQSGADDDDPLDVPAGTLAPRDFGLGHLTRKTTPRALASFLRDPLAVRPSGRMPSLGLDAEEAAAVAAYLLRDQAGEEPGDLAPGLTYEYFEEAFRDRPDFDAFTPKRRGTIDAFRIDDRDRDDDFGFRFSGFVTLPRDGEYTFSVTSDDGSHLWVDGEHVDNGGVHGMTEKSLKLWRGAGRYTILVTMFEARGGEGLKVHWEGPELEKSEIPAEALSHLSIVFQPPLAEPFAVDAARAEAGRRHFRELGCVHCHTSGTALDDEARDQPPALTALDPARGCLGSERRVGVPRFALEAHELEAVRATVADAAALAAPLDPEAAVERAFDRLSCYACHRRGDWGGVHPERREYYLADEDAELGDEGRIPPHLTAAGAKLREAYLSAVLLDGATARPYMATRMPEFGHDNVASLVEMLVAADPVPAEPLGGALEGDLIEAGRDLAGTEGGLGCIQCHTFAGARSLGVQAVDLVTMHRRLRPAWFSTLLLDPSAVNMNTRMAELFTDGKSPAEHFGGHPERQIDALWAYLSLGSAMGYPPGLVPPIGTYDLIPTARPITVGVFMKDVSPRTVCVGFAERVHYAFDVQHSTLAKVWRGDFINVEGTWHGRAGQLEVPAGVDVLDLGGGFPLRVDGKVPDARPLGRTFDAEGRPMFRYAADDVVVTDSLIPSYGGGGIGFERTRHFESARRVRVALEEGGATRELELTRNGRKWETTLKTEVRW